MTATGTAWEWRYVSLIGVVTPLFALWTSAREGVAEGDIKSRRQLTVVGVVLFVGVQAWIALVVTTDDTALAVASGLALALGGSLLMNRVIHRDHVERDGP